MLAITSLYHRSLQWVGLKAPLESPIPHLNDIIKDLALSLPETHDEWASIKKHLIDHLRDDQLSDLIEDPKWIENAQHLLPAGKTLETFLSPFEAISNCKTPVMERTYYEYLAQKLPLTLLSKLVAFAALSVLMAFNIDLDHPPRSSWQAQNQLVFFNTLITSALDYIKMVTDYLTSPTMRYLALTASATAVYLAYRLLNLVLELFPQELPFSDNLSLKAKHNNLRQPEICGRENELNEIIRTLSAETKTMRKPIFLVGPTGSGKTALVEGLAQAIARGNVPDQLKGKTVCLINSAKIAGSSYSWSETRSMSMPPLDRLFADLEGKEEDVILFFDEIQAAKVGKGTVTTANLLQTLKSKSDGGQLNLMIATTDKEYREQMAHDIAFFGRFHTIFVNELKGPALISFLLERYRKLPLSRAAIEKAVELLSKDETRTTAFPRAAIQLLDYVASELNFSGDPEMHKQLEELNSEKSLAERILKTQIARDPTLSDMTQLERIQRLTGLIHTLETSLSQKRNDFDYLWQLKNRVIALQDSLFDLSEKAIQEKNTAQKTKLIGQMILTHQVALPALRRILRQEKFKYEVTYESLFVEEISSETVEHLFHHMREQRLKALPGKSSQDSIGTSVELADDDLP